MSGHNCPPIDQVNVTGHWLTVDVSTLVTRFTAISKCPPCRRREILNIYYGLSINRNISYLATLPVSLVSGENPEQVRRGKGEEWNWASVEERNVRRGCSLPVGVQRSQRSPDVWRVTPRCGQDLEGSVFVMKAERNQHVMCWENRAPHYVSPAIVHWIDLTRGAEELRSSGSVLTDV